MNNSDHDKHRGRQAISAVKFIVTIHSFNLEYKALTQEYLAAEGERQVEHLARRDGPVLLGVIDRALDTSVDGVGQFARHLAGYPLVYATYFVVR